MEELLNNQDKKYIPVETSINGFSYFTDTHFALYISDNTLYFINLLTGETGEIDEFSESEVTNVKCISSDKFVVATFENIYLANFTQNNINIQKEYSIDHTAAKSIDATSDANIIALSAYENLIVISKGELKSQDMIHIQYSMAISKDGKYIASGSESGIKILDSSSLEVIKEFATEAIPITISFSPNGKILLYGDDNKNLISIRIDTGKTTSYKNPFFSKPIYTEWLDEGSLFVVSFLSQCISLYSIDKAAGRTIELKEFPSRYFQNANLINKDIIAICVENLRTSSKVESVPTSNVIVLQRINNEN